MTNLLLSKKWTSEFCSSLSWYLYYVVSAVKFNTLALEEATIKSLVHKLSRDLGFNGFAYNRLR